MFREVPIYILLLFLFVYIFPSWYKRWYINEIIRLGGAKVRCNQQQSNHQKFLIVFIVVKVRF